MERTLGKCPVGLINELAHSLSLPPAHTNIHILSM